MYSTNLFCSTYWAIGSQSWVRYTHAPDFSWITTNISPSHSNSMPKTFSSHLNFLIHLSVLQAVNANRNIFLNWDKCRIAVQEIFASQYQSNESSKCMNNNLRIMCFNLKMIIRNSRMPKNLLLTLDPTEKWFYHRLPSLQWTRRDVFASFWSLN